MKALLLIISLALLTGCEEDFIARLKVSTEINPVVLETIDIFWGTLSTGEEIIVFDGPGYKDCLLDVDENGVVLENYVVWEFGTNNITLVDGEKVSCVDLTIPYVSSTDVGGVRILE